MTIGEETQFRSKSLGIRDTVFFRKENAVSCPQFLQDLHDFKANGAAADDEALYALKTKLLLPRACRIERKCFHGNSETRRK